MTKDEFGDLMILFFFVFFFFFVFIMMLTGSYGEWFTGIMRLNVLLFSNLRFV